VKRRKRMRQLIKDWLVRLTEPWREEKAALDLEWRLYAQKMNAAGARPQFWYPGMELDPEDKVELQDECETDPNCLRDAINKATDRLG
jgi:hypothetical protein